jgi:uncharacterized membrane protein YkoI
MKTITMKKYLSPLLVAALLAVPLLSAHAATADPAAAQKEIDSLKARLAELEAQQAAANQPADLATLNTISVADAAKAALAAAPGKVGRITLTAKPSGATYAVEVAGADGSVTTVELDAVSGKVAGSSTEFGARRPAAQRGIGGMAPNRPGQNGQRPARAREEDDD